MLFYKDAFHRLRQDLQPLYDDGEAIAITREIFLELTGITYTESLVKQDQQLGPDILEKLDLMKKDLLGGKPLQYVLGHGWFMGRAFIVNENVLIPRPETEELVQWIVDDWQANETELQILDIGTGSGCIPISLKLKLDKAVVTSCDISEGAIKVAKLNANNLGASVNFMQLDFLNPDSRNQLGKFDIIVSNPPYIPVNEKETLHVNVRDYEPGTALFVPNDDALLFYREICNFGKDHLTANGTVYCELHKDFAQESLNLFKENGYGNCQLKKDINGHWRMLKASL